MYKEQLLIKVNISLLKYSGVKKIAEWTKKSGSIIKHKAENHSVGLTCAEVRPETTLSLADDFVLRYFESSPMAYGRNFK